MTAESSVPIGVETTENVCTAVVVDSAQEKTEEAKGTVVSSGTEAVSDITVVSIRDSNLQAVSVNNPLTMKRATAKRQGRGKIQVVTTTARRVLPARKGKKAAASTELEVDELDVSPAPPAKHLFIFPEGATGEDKLMAILSSNYVLDKKYAEEVVFFMKPDVQDFPVLYKDFVRLHEKQFTTTHVVSAFFHLMDRQFNSTGNHQRFADCSLWCNYILNQDNRPPDRLTAAFYTYFTIGKDEILYIPMVNNNHFMLVVILFEDLRMEVYDSLHFKHEHEVAKILSFLKIIFDRDLAWSVSYNQNNHKKIQNIPRQTDSYSCGFYASWYAFIHARNGYIPMLPNDRNISDIARGVFISLLENKLYDKLLYVE